MQSKKVYYHRAGSAFSSTLFASQLMQLTEQYFSLKTGYSYFLFFALAAIVYLETALDQLLDIN